MEGWPSSLETGTGNLETVTRSSPRVTEECSSSFCSVNGAAQQIGGLGGATQQQLREKANI